MVSHWICAGYFRRNVIKNVSNDFLKSLTYRRRLYHPWVDDPKSTSVRNIIVSYFEYFAATQRHACGSAGFRNAAMVAQKISWDPYKRYWSRRVPQCVWFAIRLPSRGFRLPLWANGARINFMGPWDPQGPLGPHSLQRGNPLMISPPLAEAKAWGWLRQQVVADQSWQLRNFGSRGRELRKMANSKT